MIGNKVADIITSLSKKKSTKNLHNNDDDYDDDDDDDDNETKEEDVEITTHQKRYVSSEEWKQIIEELRLVPKKDVYFLKLLMN